MKRYFTHYLEGLSDEQVCSRVQEGLVNIDTKEHSKSYQRIFFDNIFTLFNFINLILAILILLTGSYRNLLFLGVVFSNIFIGTVQEIRAKRTLDKISLIVSLKVCVIRNGEEVMIPVQDVVLDDIVKLKVGNQIISDCIIVKGDLEVDESLLTGESDVVVKGEGASLYSGSYVVGSYAYVRVDKVGDDNYASRMLKDAKKLSKYPSELRDSLNKIIKYIGIFIIPLGIGLFFKQFFYLDNSLHTSILSTSAALIGMIPEGLVILTSVALAVGIINLAKHRTLVQELYCLETLARVDVLCLDKTGTITEGKMEVEKMVSYHDRVEVIMGNLIASLKDDNATFYALKNHFKPYRTLSLEKVIPFNSKRKFSGAIFEEATYLIGAYEFLMPQENASYREEIEQYANEGYRVLTLVESVNTNDFMHNTVLAFILLRDKIRANAKSTLAYFKEQGVQIKVISGDHPITVSMVAKRAGLDGYDRYIDATTLHSIEDIETALLHYQIFGRVTPTQKKQMIAALKKERHVVAMSGDGVNDVLAFKEADVSIAMASGSDMAKASANLVLLDSNFDALPYVLNEGRRVINNIQRVATLFLTKTFFSCLLVCMSLLFEAQYPFVPIQLTFVSTFTIGLPAFFMTLEPNYNRVKKNFLENIFCVSLPAAISVIMGIVYVNVVASIFQYSDSIISQLALIVISFNGLLVLSKVSKPYSKERFIILFSAMLCIINGLLFGSSIFAFAPIKLEIVGIHVIVIMGILVSVSYICTWMVKNVYEYKRAKNH